MNSYPSKSKEAYKLMHDGVLALARAERQGLRVDVEYVQTKKQHLTRKIERLEEQFKETKFYKHWDHSMRRHPNIYSNAQLAAFLYKVKKIKPPKETESGQGATDEEALLSLEIPELKDLIQIRKLRKIRDTYLEGFEKEAVYGYIHPSFNLHLVRTFRSSSDRPNFQNIPKRDYESMQTVRKALYPRPGHQLLEVDYSGLEVRIAACYHKDTTMLEYLKTGYDMHSDMAQQLFVIDGFDKSKPNHAYLRSATKNGFVFPQFYGDWYGSCAEYLACNWGKLPKSHFLYTQGVEVEKGRLLGQHLSGKGIHTYKMFEEHVKKIEADFWGRRFFEYAQWKEKWWKEYQKKGYIEMLTGFTCSGVMSRNDCINYPVQGSAFHCLLWSFNRLDAEIRRKKIDSKIVGQIHDAIVLDVNPQERDDLVVMIKSITTVELPQAWPWIIVPLEVDFELCPIDASWAEKKSYGPH